MTECELCKGTGKLIKPWYDTTGAMTGMTGDICFMCDGKGTIGEPMTNEEWFCQLSTEEKAEFLQSISVLSLKSKDEDLEDWKAWLKQPHKE